jgi:hypothetical protein
LAALGSVLSIALLLAATSRAHADTVLTPNASSDAFPLTLGPGALVAQADADDTYDPFSDYSEFEESMEEEEDINFFKNGRLFTMGFIGGYRGWTQNFGKYYSGSPTFGVFISYFFDLRFALQFGFLSSDHILRMAVPGFETVKGTVSMTDIQFALKYYFNTQNVTRGLADLNPYIIGGFSQIYRTTTVSSSSNFGKDSAFAFDIGGGIEIPMMRNKMYFGIQGIYQMVNFSNEGSTVQDPNANDTGQTLSGDSFLALGILGVNF